VAVAERLVACRQHQDAAAATHDDAVVAVGWWSMGDGVEPMTAASPSDM